MAKKKRSIGAFVKMILGDKKNPLATVMIRGKSKKQAAAKAARFRRTFIKNAIEVEPEVPVRLRSGKWTIARFDESKQKYIVSREHGYAYGNTPKAAASAAFWDGGHPNELYRTKKDAIAGNEIDRGY